jgi:alkylated DNA repair dioxygenase AlkB
LRAAEAALSEHPSGDEVTPLERGYRYVPAFLDAAAAGLLFAQLRSEVCWRAETIRLFGRSIEVPRRVAWYGDAGCNYRYAGLDHPCSGWLPALQSLRDRIATEFGLDTHMALLNLYRDGRDGMGWHTDAEPGQGAVLGSLSLGATRRFRLRLPTGALTLALEHGSLLLMAGALPHALPKTRRPVAERINLTFRTLTGGTADGRG